MKHWTNWSGGVTARPAQTIEIADEARLSDILRSSAQPLKVAGAGHSFSPLVQSDGPQVVLSGLTSVRENGPDSVRAGAGVVLRNLTEKMHGMGHALANMGDVDGQRLGGALATATHGTGADFTCYSAMLREFTMIDGQGARHVISRDSDANAFRALAVSLGTGGILTEAVMATVPPYRLAKRRFALSLGELLEDFDRLIRQGRNTEFYYITHSGMALGMDSVASDDALVARPPDRDAEGLRQLKQAGRLLGRFPGLRRWALGRAMKSHSTECFTEDWHRAYPTERDRVRFEETEWHIPSAAAPQVLARVIDTVERHFPQVYFPMEIRITGPDDLYLSPFFNLKSVSIAVHHEAGQPFDALMDAIQPIFCRADGRPHWGKRHKLTVGDLRPLYPHWSEAIEARRHFDPKGRFLTPYLRRLLGL